MRIENDHQITKKVRAGIRVILTTSSLLSLLLIPLVMIMNPSDTGGQLYIEYIAQVVAYFDFYLILWGVIPSIVLICLIAVLNRQTNDKIPIKREVNLALTSLVIIIILGLSVFAFHQ